jgi:hypothetical protein
MKSNSMSIPNLIRQVSHTATKEAAICQPLRDLSNSQSSCAATADSATGIRRVTAGAFAIATERLALVKKVPSAINLGRPPDVLLRQIADNTFLSAS